MEKKQATSATASSNPLGVCEKIFHAIHTNATFRPLRRLTFRNEDANTNTSPPLLDHHDSPNSDTKHSSTPMKPPQPGPHEKKTPSESVGAEKTGAEAKPKAAKPKKEMNQKIEEFIIRTKGKIRTGSTVGRVPSSK